MWNSDNDNNAYNRLYNNINRNYNSGWQEEEAYKYYEQLLEEGSPNNIKHEVTSMIGNDSEEKFLNHMFILAIREQSIDKIQIFLNAGIDINKPAYKGGESFVFNAVYTDNPEIVTLFLDNGGNIESVNNEGNTPLHKAVIAQKINSIGLLLERGANVNTENNYKNTPLISAIISGNTDIIELLLKSHKLDINYQNKDGNTALIAALDYEKIDMALLLIKHGANINLANNEGEKPIDLLLKLLAEQAPDGAAGGAGVGAEPAINARLASAISAAAWKRRRAAVLARATRGRPAAGVAKNTKRRRTRRRRIE